MNNFLHLIPATGWRIRIFDRKDQNTTFRDVAAFALRRDGEVVPLIHIINGTLEEPPPSSDLWAVELLGPSDENYSDLPTLLRTKSSEPPLDQKLSNRTETAPPQTNYLGVPKDTRPTEIQILALIDCSERELDRGLDTERLMCRCTGDVLETLARLRADKKIEADPFEKWGPDFYRLLERGREALREFRNSAVSER
jgi:hypothetical protein